MDMDLEEPTEQFIIMPLAHKKARQWYYQNRAHDLADHEKKQLCDTLAEAAKENYRSDGFNPRVYRIISECDLDQPTQIPR